MNKSRVTIVITMLSLVGGFYNVRLWYRLEPTYFDFHDELTFRIAAIFSFAPYVLLMLGAYLFCRERRLAFWVLVASIIFPFASIMFLSVGMLFISESSSLFSHQFSVLIVGSAPFISIISSFVLLPSFLKLKRG